MVGQGKGDGGGMLENSYAASVLSLALGILVSLSRLRIEGGRAAIPSIQGVSST